MQVIERGESVRLTRRLIGRRGVIAVLLWIVLAAHNRDGAAKRRNSNGDCHHAPRPRSEWKGGRERGGGDAPRSN